MAAYLIGSDGPFAGMIIRLEEGEEWTIGRDPDECSDVLEDPLVSRKHVKIAFSDEGYRIENLSSVNTATIGDEPISEPTLLKEGDVVTIGGTSFRFTEEEPVAKEEAPTMFGEDDVLDSLSYTGNGEAKWLLKIISGPNSGGEIGVEAGSSAIIGKDPLSCEIVFNDLSVSSRHAKISCSDDGIVTIEDLESKNGTLVNGRPIQEPKELKSQDLIAMGSTSFLIVDREEARETIVSAPILAPVEEEPPRKNWKEMIIPSRHLALGGLIAFVVIFGVFSSLSLFKTTEIGVEQKDESKDIAKVLKRFPDVEFSYNPSSGKLFLLGHVMTEVDHREMTYLLKGLPYVNSLDDNVVIDEQVWENFNPLLARNPNWRSVTVSSTMPGDFVLRGYLENQEQYGLLSEYVNSNFPYLDRLKNEVVVENTLGVQVQSILISHGFGGVSFQVADGELVLAGRVEKGEERAFNKMVKELKGVKGIRGVKTYVVFADKGTARINISSQYQVTGSSLKNDKPAFVVINGKVLGKGDEIDGMIIENVEEDGVFLEKDGIKYRINYNPQ